MADDLDRRIAEQDREYTRLVRDLGETSAQIVQLRAVLDALEDEGPSTGDRQSTLALTVHVHTIYALPISALPPVHSGIADYSAELLSPLGERARIDLFVDDPANVKDLGFPFIPSLTFPNNDGTMMI
ncbi:MAG: hypothetical protein R3C44_14170 [Chloroflexota bacterium]